MGCRQAVKAQDFDSCIRGFESRQPSTDKKPETFVILSGFRLFFVIVALRQAVMLHLYRQMGRVLHRGSIRWHLQGKIQLR